MVDFVVDDDVRAITRTLRDFVEREVAPLEKRHAKLLGDERFMLGDDGFLHPDLVRAVDDIRRKSAAAGFYAMHMPQDVGGGGVGKVGMFEAWRSIMARPLGLNMSVLSFVEGPSPLFLHFSDDQRARYLDPCMRGEMTSAFCLTEPEAGSDVSRIATTAAKKNGTYVLNGTKAFVTNGPYADFYQVFAKTDQSAGLGGMSCFLVDRDAPGVNVGAAMNSLVNDGQQCEVVLDNAEVPAANLVGDEGSGFMLAIGNINDTRVSIAGMCVGLAEYLVDQMVSYANQREAFGKPIGKLGQVQAYIAESATELYAMENMVLNCCWRIDQGMETVKETSMVKLYATEALFRIADRAIQVHGGNGLMREVPLERIFRFARVLRIPEGTSEIQRWTIAKTLGL